MLHFPDKEEGEGEEGAAQPLQKLRKEEYDDSLAGIGRI